jgi:hypothetical protein
MLCQEREGFWNIEMLVDLSQRIFFVFRVFLNKSLIY